MVQNINRKNLHFLTFKMTSNGEDLQRYTVYANNMRFYSDSIKRLLMEAVPLRRLH